MNESPASVLTAESSGQSDPLDDLPVAYVEMNSRGVIVRANRLTRAQHYSEAGELIGRLAWEFVPIEEQEPNCAAFMAALQSGVDPPPVLRSVFTRSGSFRTLELHRNLIRDAAGQPTGMRVVSVDVTDALKVAEEERRTRIWLESVLAAMADAVIVTDALGFIRTVNPAAEEMFGWTAAELKGKVIERVLPVLSYRSRDAAQASFKHTLDKRTRGVATILDHERREVRVEIGTSPILDSQNGGTIGVVKVLRRLDDPVA